MMGTGFVRRYIQAARLAVLAGLVAAPSSIALARTDTVRWEHPDPAEVAGFRVYWSPRPLSMGPHPFFVDVGWPEPDSDGVHSYALEVADDADVYVVVTAYDAWGQESRFSNEGYRSAPLAASSSSSGMTASSQEFEIPAVLAPPGGAAVTPDSGVTNASPDSGSLTDTSHRVRTRAHRGAQPGASLHKAAATDSTETNTGYEYVGRMLITEPNAAIGVTLRSRYSDDDAYYWLKRSANIGVGDFHFQAHPRGLGNRMRCSSVRTGVVPSPLSWYWFRFQVSSETDETEVRAKVWEEGTTEPTTWQVSCYDGRRDGLTAAAGGVWRTGTRSQYWEDLEVLDLASEASPVPRAAPPRYAP